MVLDALNTVLLFASGHGLLLATLLLYKYGRLYANRFLAAYMLCFSLILVNLILEDIGLFDRFPYSFVLQAIFVFAVSPLHYLYTLYLCHSGRRFRARALLHFAPSLAAGLLFALLISVQDAPLSTRYEQTPPALQLLNWAIIVQGFAYIGASLLLLHRYSRDIRKVFSATEKVQLRWLRNISYAIGGLLLVFLLENILMFFDLNLSDFFNLSSLLSGLTVYLLGYLGLFKSEIFSAPDISATMQGMDTMLAESPTEPGTESNEAHKYEKSGLSPEQAQANVHRLLHLMHSQKPYLNSDLTLLQLAAMLDISPHNLSETINTQLAKNFFDFVNGYRVEEVQRLLADPRNQHLTILALAFEAGFNSKTSFNTIFKKATGITPSAWRKNALADTGS